MSLLEKLGLKKREKEIVTVKQFDVSGYKMFAGDGIGVGAEDGKKALVKGGVMVRTEPYTSLQHYLDQVALLRLTGSATECGFEAYVKEHVNTHGGRGGDATHETDCQKHTQIYLLPPGNTTLILNPSVRAGHMEASIELRCQGKEPEYLSRLIADIGARSSGRIFVRSLDGLFGNRHGDFLRKGLGGIMYQR